MDFWIVQEFNKMLREDKAEDNENRIIILFLYGMVKHSCRHSRNSSKYDDYDDTGC